MLARGQRTANGRVKGLETKLYEEWLWKLVTFSLGKRRLRGNIIAIFEYSKGCYVDTD